LPTCDAVLTIRPRFCSFMIREAARVHAITPRTFTENTLSITSSGVSTTCAIGWATPALLHRMSSEPNSRPMSAITSSTSAVFATSR
jgi:hypothetical protein